MSKFWTWLKGLFSSGSPKPAPELPTPTTPVEPETEKPAPTAPVAKATLRDIYIAKCRSYLWVREDKGPNRSTQIDAWNKVTAYLGAPYCITALTMIMKEVCAQLDLALPKDFINASTQNFYNSAPTKYKKPRGKLGRKGDVGILVNKSNSSTGHAFALTENEPAEGASPTIEFNTNGEGSSNGDGAYERHRLQSGTSSQTFRGYVDVVQWVLDTNPSYVDGSSPGPVTPSPSVKASLLYKTGQGIHGVPNAAFVDELFQIFLKMPDVAFQANNATDIYSSIASTLGPWTSVTHRKAAGFDAMIALAGRESEWNWTEGRDLSASNTSAETEESGAWQTSCNGKEWHPQAKALLNGMTCRQYVAKAKTDHEFAALFTWWVVRGTNRHHGPLLRGEILPYLSRSRVEQLTEMFA